MRVERERSTLCRQRQAVGLRGTGEVCGAARDGAVSMSRSRQKAPLSGPFLTEAKLVLPCSYDKLTFQASRFGLMNLDPVPQGAL